MDPWDHWGPQGNIGIHVGSWVAIGRPCRTMGDHWEPEAAADAVAVAAATVAIVTRGNDMDSGTRTHPSTPTPLKYSV